ncbi:uncharacterized protein LOC106672141 isoform X2 [Cimex lectularius]|uniref:Uncharacterized protein n=1 Tax=Cimex lectularius TaxID=79782 RepID=A0A8I6S8Z6_CIMLE|nr:uncharacterized protein LOC106672141 isoform X2 [Cimex lectularius]
MLFRSERKFTTAKKENPFVGPNTYVIYYPLDLKQEAVPFRFKIGHRSLPVICSPGPNKYNIKYRKHRIIGGSSLRYTAARKTRDLDNTEPPPEKNNETRAKPKGKIYRGHYPRYGCPVTSTNSYKIPDGNPRFKKKKISFYIREPYYPNKNSLRCKKYSGPRWGMSKTSTHRLNISKSNLPSPADYYVKESGPTPQQLWDWSVRQEVQRNESINNCIEKTLEKSKKESLPGPFDTFVDPSIFKKKSFNVKGTFTKAKRAKSPVCSDEPSPQSFYIKDTFGVTCLNNKKRPPFNNTSSFPKLKTHPVGPADYNPTYNTITFNICKKLPPISAGFVAPFNNTAKRSLHNLKNETPSPFEYDTRPKKKIRFCEEPLGILSSKTPRFPKQCESSPSPLDYDIHPSTNTRHCSHAKLQRSFNNTEKRIMEIKEPDYNAAPNSYFPSKDGVLPSPHNIIIARDVGESTRCRKPPPGPTSYERILKKMFRTTLLTS